MREIKFRQPLFYKEKFNCWFYWGFIDGGFISPQNFQSQSYAYTGFKDINKKEIYEGHIIGRVAFGTKYYTKNEVKYDNKKATYVYSNMSGDNEIWHDVRSTIQDIKIVGNIVENPELLEED